MELHEKKILVIGTVFLDIKGFPDGDFVASSRNVGSITYVHGGVGRNVAEDVAALGAHTVFISLSEDSPFGIDIRKRLDTSGVETSYMLDVPDGIGTWMAIFNPEGDVHSSVSKRQDLSPLIPMLQEKGEELFRDCDGVLLEMDVDESLVALVFQLAEQYHVDVYGVISNMNIAKQRLSFIQRTRCFICNRYEAGILFDTHMPADNPALVLQMLEEKMSALEIPCMIVTLDKDGSVYACKEKKHSISGHCPAYPVEIVDSTGAGDAFFAGASVSMIAGKGIEEACSIGTQMAAKVLVTGENVYKPE